MSDGFEPIDVSRAPLEEVRDVLSVLFVHLNLQLYRRESFYDGAEYQIRPRPRPAHWAPPVGACIFCNTLPCSCAIALSRASDGEG